MKLLTKLVLLTCCPVMLAAQSPAEADYLARHRTDLRSGEATIAQRIVGFTVIHGSQKAEDAELALLSTQLAHTDTLHYFPEVDAAMAYYFNQYLQSGDEVLLRDLVLSYEARVPQEASIAMFDKWRKLRKLSEGKQLQVYGIDVVVSYKHYVSLLIELSGADSFFRDSLSAYQQNRQTDYSVKKNTTLKQCLKYLSNQYQLSKAEVDSKVKNSELFAYLMDNLNDSFKEKEQVRRDSLITKNYLRLREQYGFSMSKQFIRMGVYHMAKECFVNTQPGFIAALIESGAYKSSDIYVVQALMYQSKVLMRRTYNDRGEYTGYTEESGFYAGETLPQTGMLAANSLSDLTFFDLSKKGSPLRQILGLDLVTLKLLPDKSMADYFNGAILVKDSPANVPIEALK